MKSIRQILERKGSKVISVSPDTRVEEALNILNEKNIGSLAVMEGDKYLGILTERDYARKVFIKGKSSKDTTAGQIMTTDFPVLKSTDSIEHCMQLMTDNNLKYLPVMNGDKIEGLISIMDVVQETILSQQETISELHNYISGSSYSN
jgi:CBS domain-containing protein